MRSSEPQAPRPIWPLVVACWLIVVAIVAGLGFFGVASQPLLADTDDAMRLVTVQDFLAGQDWYDHAQYRLNLPAGAEMHWSRLIDVPIALLIVFFQPLAGEASVTLAAYVWPLILLLPLLYVSAKVTLRLVGPEGALPGVVLPVLTPAVMAEFLPGRLDHHGVQIILSLVMMWCAIEAIERPRWAIGAGLAAATALAVGAESVPSVAATVLAFGLMWVFLPTRAGALRGFGLSLGAGTVLHLMIAWPPSRWLEPSCDTISFVFAATAVGIGAALTVLSVLPLPERNVFARLGAGSLAGIALVGVVVTAFPHCLAGYNAGLDAWLVETWAKQIIESRPIWRSVSELPDLVVAMAIPGALAIAVTVREGTRPGEKRGRWLIYGLFLAVTVVVTIVMVRGGRFSGIAAVPACACLIAAARSRYVAAPNLASVGALLASWLLSAGIIIMAAVAALLAWFAPPADAEAAAVVATERATCIMPEVYDDLAALEPQQLMAPVDLGAHLLAFTRHSVVAAPYPRNFQRNAEGLRDSYLFFNEPIDEARKLLDARGVTLVVVCPRMMEMQTTDTPAPDSFVVLYREGELPSWLREISPPEAILRIYEVTASSRHDGG